MKHSVEDLGKAAERGGKDVDGLGKQAQKAGGKIAAAIATSLPPRGA